jgi:photosystem I subunit V
MASLANKTALRTSRAGPVRAARRTVRPVAALDTAIAISGSTAAFLTLGRFVFLPYQRREAAWNSQARPRAYLSHRGLWGAARSGGRRNS